MARVEAVGRVRVEIELVKPLAELTEQGGIAQGTRSGSARSALRRQGIGLHRPRPAAGPFGSAVTK